MTGPPPASQWVDLVLPYTRRKADFQCPAVTAANLEGFGYAFFSELSSRAIASIEDQRRAPLLFNSSNQAKNAADVGNTFANAPPRHFLPQGNGGANLIFLDGRLAFLPAFTGSRSTLR